ncbi:hypothetical protein ACH5AU_03315 [Streptomyces albidoflavus]
MGADDAPQVVERLAHARVKWPSAKLLAELYVSAGAVTDALTRLAADRRADEADRPWAARAPSRLGRTDPLLALADRLPEEVRAQGLAAPYAAFRDVGAHAPLDYRPLEQTLDTRPGLHAAVLDAFRPGRGLCETGPAEADAALDGLDSRWPAVHCHALLILGGPPALPGAARTVHRRPHPAVPRGPRRRARGGRRVRPPDRAVNCLLTRPPDTAATPRRSAPRPCAGP